MQKSFKKMLQGYREFQKKYASGDNQTMEKLADHGQSPETMFIACSDSRVDPALLLQCNPGDIFVVRNVANIVPPYEIDERHHGISAALEFGVCYLNVKHLVILGHSQCGGIDALLNDDQLEQNDFITRWVSILKKDATNNDIDQVAQKSLLDSYQNCLSFPWIKKQVEQGALAIHLWFFNIKDATIFDYSFENKLFQPLNGAEENF